MIPERCPKCGESGWEGDQEVTAPTSFENGAYWHRRTHCLFCRTAVEEIAGGGLVAVTSRTEGIRWWGANPWLVRRGAGDEA